MNFNFKLKKICRHCIVSLKEKSLISIYEKHSIYKHAARSRADISYAHVTSLTCTKTQTHQWIHVEKRYIIFPSCCSKVSYCTDLTSRTCLPLYISAEDLGSSGNTLFKLLFAPDLVCPLPHSASYTSEFCRWVERAFTHTRIAFSHVCA